MCIKKCAASKKCEKCSTTISQNYINIKVDNFVSKMATLRSWAGNFVVEESHKNITSHFFGS